MSKDKEIWSAYAKTVKRLGKKPAAKPAPKPKRVAKISKATKERIESAPLPVTRPVSITPAAPHRFDRRKERDLREGEVAIEARIDLHGMTQEKAYAALARFMAKVARHGHRHLLIITGKGKGNAGVLKTNLPDWLHNLPESARILAVRPAAPKHGGNGAYYVVLRNPAKGRKESGL